MRPALFILPFLVACASPNQVRPHGQLGVAAHHAEAAEHDQRAADHDRAVRRLESDPTSYTCGDSVLFHQSTSGGERLTGRVPCWSAEAAGGEEHRRAAERERIEAERHRALARQLHLAEVRSCASLPPDERDHTPFWHRSDVLAVERIVAHAGRHGVRVTFRRVPSLTGAWMEQALRCHRARAAALGWDARYMGYDPSLFDRALVDVRETPGAILVDVVSADPDIAAVIVGRAEALLQPAPEPDQLPANP
jgi:hypothetical protein